MPAHFVRNVLASVLAVSGILAAGDAAAFDVNHAPGGALVHQSQTSVVFEVDPALARAVPGALQAVTTAMAAWSGVGGAPTLSAEVGKGGAQPANDGVDNIIFAPHGYDEAGDALAITINWVDDASGAIVDADVVVNGLHDFAVLPAGSSAPVTAFIATEGGHSQGSPYGTFDLEHVMTHELGHALGLADVQADSSDVMYALSAPGSAAGRAPTSDDLDGVDAIYGGAAPRAGCGQSNLAGSSPSRRDLLVSVAALSFALARLGSRSGRANRTARLSKVA